MSATKVALFMYARLIDLPELFQCHLFDVVLFYVNTFNDFCRNVRKCPDRVLWRLPKMTNTGCRRYEGQIK